MNSVVIHGSLGQRKALSLWLPIRHNFGVLLPLIISGHEFCGYPWLSRSEAGPISLAAREELKLILGFWELYILYPSQLGIIVVYHYL